LRRALEARAVDQGAVLLGAHPRLLRANLGVCDIDAGEGDRLFQDRRAVALVITPIWARPTCTQSPWPTASSPSIGHGSASQCLARRPPSLAGRGHDQEAAA
jgi:hypothetical protein